MAQPHRRDGISQETTGRTHRGSDRHCDSLRDEHNLTWLVTLRGLAALLHTTVLKYSQSPSGFHNKLERGLCSDP